VARKDPGPIPHLRRITLPGAKGANHPGFVKPQLATLHVRPPTSDRYIHELKLDGYRVQCHLRGGLVSLWTRSGLDWTKRFPPVAAGISNVAASDLVIDGEVISAMDDGRANFSQLQDDLAKSRYDRMVYYAFDLLYLDGFDLRGAPLIERKRLLKEVLDQSKHILPVVYSEHFDTDGAALFEQACKLGLEGVISKRRDAPYKSERTEAWLKAKCLQVARFEVIGYKSGVTSLYLGRREGKNLIYAGKAGTGYTDKTIIELGKLMRPITVKKMPLSKKPNRRKIDCWVEPKYWAEVEYRDITTDGLLRHTTFRGLYPARSSKKALISTKRK
jgi:bifunctional non-homologous end joining protein LigD